MNKRTFDEQMKTRAAAEEMSLRAQVQERFADAADLARVHPADSPVRRSWKVRTLLALECAAAIALVLFLWPRQDVTDQDLLSQQDISSAMVPVTQPQYAKAPKVDFIVDAGQTIVLKTDVKNETDAIWLVEWQGQMKDDSASASQLLWMEPGTKCTERAWWQADGNIKLDMSYRGYRVTARVLHWMDGEWLKEDEEGYAEQQSLIEAAFEAEALILAPGIWLNGKAGPMRLVLPARYQKEHPNVTPLNYYLEKGMLKDEYLLCSGGESFVSEARTWAEEF